MGGADPMSHLVKKKTTRIVQTIFKKSRKKGSGTDSIQSIIQQIREEPWESRVFDFNDKKPER